MVLVIFSPKIEVLTFNINIQSLLYNLYVFYRVFLYNNLYAKKRSLSNKKANNLYKIFVEPIFSF